MLASFLITSAFKLSSNARPEIHEAWIAHSLKLGEVAGTVHLVNAQQNGRLDLLLRQLDSEPAIPPKGDIDFCLTIRSAFSNIWVLSAYEMIRAAHEQIRLKGQENQSVSALKDRLGLVRMPIAKAQIQGNTKETRDIVLAHADGSDPKQYSNDGSYFVPSGICSETGSAVWVPVDAKTKQNSQIRRIDLSNELLALFD